MRRPAAWRAGLTVLLLLICAVTPALSEHPEIAKRRAAERRTFSDAEIARGFFAVAFGAELGLAGNAERIRRYEQPVRIYFDQISGPDRKAALVKVVDDIRQRIANIDMAVTDVRAEANFIVHLVRDDDLAGMVRKLYGAAGRRIVRSLEPQCLSGIRRDPQYRIAGSDVILVTDAGDFIFYDCAYEELLQALGPIRDDDTIPWTMFNDDVQKGFFDIYDQYILNILYHPRTRAGTTRREMRRLLPEIMPAVREIVTRNNSLKR